MRRIAVTKHSPLKSNFPIMEHPLSFHTGVFRVFIFQLYNTVVVQWHCRLCYLGQADEDEAHLQVKEFSLRGKYSFREKLDFIWI